LGDNNDETEKSQGIVTPVWIWIWMTAVTMVTVNSKGIDF